MNKQEIIRSALLRVADNVAKHVIQRSGWTESDVCFQADLRESEQELTDIVSDCMEAAKLRLAFKDTLGSLKFKDVVGCRDLDRDLDKMSPNELRSLLAKWQRMWMVLYESIRDSQAGLSLLKEVEKTK